MNNPYDSEFLKLLTDMRYQLAEIKVLLEKLVEDKNTKKIVLIHLSEENNTPEIAADTLITMLKEKKKNVPEIEIAKQKESTEFIEIW